MTQTTRNKPGSSFNVIVSPAFIGTHNYCNMVASDVEHSFETILGDGIREYNLHF